jgi:hypothetical protein
MNKGVKMAEGSSKLKEYTNLEIEAVIKMIL